MTESFNGWDDHRKLTEVLIRLDLVLIKLDELEKAMTSGQAEIDADVASLTASEAGIASAVQELVAEIAVLQSQGVDTTALDAIAAKFTADASADAADVPPAS